MSEAIVRTTVPARAHDVLSSEVSDLAVLMSMDTGKFIELNETGRAVWNLTDGSNNVGDVVDQLSERYDVAPETCLQEVVALYDQLREQGLVELAG